MLSRIGSHLKISLFIVLGILMLHAYSEAEAMKAGIKEAEPSEVCMVNDAVMGREQIPVEFEGKTYYGCCAGCVERIKSDRTVRYAVDPVTGKEVDKSKAVILEGPQGEAIYFESADSALRYRINAMK